MSDKRVCHRCGHECSGSDYACPACHCVVLGGVTGDIMRMLTLTLRRAPVLLRVVHGPDGRDTLDQLEDTPRPEETVHVYRLMAPPTMAMVDGRDPKTGKRTGGCRYIGIYELLPDQPNEATLRDNKAWTAWCGANFERLTPEWCRGKAFMP